MSELSAQIVAEVVAACRNGLGETVEALGRALDAKFTAEVGEATALDRNVPEFDGPALAVLMSVGGTSAIGVLPEAGGLLPAWVAAPDPTGTSKLTTLAQELSMLVLPETLMADDFRAARVADAGTALGQASPADDAQGVPIRLKTDDGREAALWVLFPFAEGAKVFEPAAAAAQAEGEAAGRGAAAGGPAAPQQAAPQLDLGAELDLAPKAKPAAPPAEKLAEKPIEKPAGVLRGDAAKAAVAAEERRRNVQLGDLPNYAKSLLKIRVPVMVTLARKKQPLGKIVEIGPGTIIQFSKGCDQPLDLEVNGEHIGQGEAVKVGDKFGLRVSAMKLPDERFKKVGDRKR
jgi:flagellar motor switch/type III secretory pathway protein FliN